MKVSEILSIIEKHAPSANALSYDNVGLLIGDKDAEVNSIVVAVDLTRDVIEKSVKIGANLVVTHHPILFNGVRQLVKGNYEQEIIALAIRSSLNVIACHTNADNAPRGLNYCTAERLGGKNITVLCEDGSGVYADIDEDFDKFTERVSRLVKGVLRVRRGKSDIVKRFAVITGAGGRDGELVNTLVKAGADCYLTAEAAHHFVLGLSDRGIGLIEFGHYESERIFIDIMSGWLKESGLEITKAFNGAFEN